MVSLTIYFIVPFILVNTGGTRSAPPAASTRTFILCYPSGGAIVYSGGTSREVGPTDAAGVVASLVALRRTTSYGDRMAFGRRVITRNDSVCLGINRGIQLSSLTSKVVVISNGSTTGTTTCAVSNDPRGFSRQVGRGTGRVNVAGAGFMAPDKLSSSGRCSDTGSVTLLVSCTLRGSSFTGLATGGDIAIRFLRPGSGGATCTGRGELLSLCPCYANKGANCAAITKQYLISSTGGSNMALIYIALGSHGS